MTTQTVQPTPVLEQALMTTIRTLPPQRARQVLDFARWLQTQPMLDEYQDEEITPAELELEEIAWEQAYLANRDNFRTMAHQALSDLETGNTLEMGIENGKVIAR